MPRHVHLDQLFRIFEYLEKKYKSEMVFDPSEPDIVEGSFKKQDWKDTVLGEFHEEITSNAP